MNRVEIMRKKVKRRLAINWATFAAAAALMTLLLCLSVMPGIGEEKYRYFISGFQVGITLAIILVAVKTIIKDSLILRSDEKLEEEYIKETDERTILIMMKSGTSAYKASLLIMLFGAVVAAYFSNDAFFALLAASLVLSLLRYITCAYYSRKL